MDFKDYQHGDPGNKRVLLHLPKDHNAFLIKLKDLGVYRSRQEAILAAIEFLSEKYPEIHIIR